VSLIEPEWSLSLRPKEKPPSLPNNTAAKAAIHEKSVPISANAAGDGVYSARNKEAGRPESRLSTAVEFLPINQALRKNVVRASAA